MPDKKICVTSQGNNLDAAVDPRFGRCAFFIIINTESMEFEVAENASAASAGGAGIVSGQFISGKGVETVLTGNVGPNAFQTLQAAGIKVITGISGTVKEAVEKYKKGELTAPVDGPSVDKKFGV